VSGGALNAGDSRARREARTEAVVVLALDVALLVGLASVDKAKGWSIVDLPWWAWVLLSAPALLLMTLLLLAPLAEMSPGRVRNGGIALLGLLVASDVVAVGVLVVALATSSTDSLSAGDLLAHGTVVWLSNIITFGLLFWLLDEGGPLLRAERGRSDPDFGFPQDAVPRAGWSARLSDYLYVSLTERDRLQPDGHDAADAPGQGPAGRGIADLVCRGDPRRRPCGERAGRQLTATGAPSRCSGAPR
jgi:hypothetical protein